MFRARGVRRGAALTLVFASVLATGVVTGSLPRGNANSEAFATRSVASTVDHEEVADAAARAVADGKSGKEAAQEVVSRSGDRWGAVYDERQYEEFEQALDGSYTGVGLAAKRSADGQVEVARVQPGGPADRVAASSPATCSVRSTATGSTSAPSPRSSPCCAGTVRRPRRAPRSSWRSGAAPTCGPRRCAGPGSPPSP